MNKLLQRIINAKNRLISKLHEAPTSPVDFRHLEIPYIKKGDPNSPGDAKLFGGSHEDYDFWRPHSCGVCCLKMVGDAVGYTNKPSMYELTQESVKRGVFHLEGGEVYGAYHFPLAAMIQEMGVPAQVEGNITNEDIKSALEAGKVVLLSVDLGKVEHSPSDESHLVAVYEEAKGEGSFFRLHDCSSVLAIDGEAALIPQDTIDSISNHKGLIVG